MRQSELKTEKKESRTVYKTTDDRVRIENRNETLSRDRMDRIDFFECGAIPRFACRVEMKIKIKIALSITFFFANESAKMSNVYRSYHKRNCFVIRFYHKP